MIRIAAIILCLLPSLSLAVEIKSGIYDEAMIVYNQKTNKLEGYINTERGQGVTFSCIFYFSGRLVNNKAAIKSYFPGDLINSNMEQTTGTLTVNGNTINVKLNDEPGGCWNVLVGQDGSEGLISYSFELNTAAKKPWQKLAIIKAEKSYFYNAPNKFKHKAYLVKGDGVGIIGSDGNWLQVEYPWSDKPIIGWMKAQDFYNLQ